VLAPACEPLEKSAGLGCAVTLKVALRVVPFAEALMVTLKGSPLYARYPALVVTVNVADDCPAGTVICGSDAASSMSELVSVTTVPPAGAAALSVTVHVAEPPLPPAITDGLHVKALAVCAKAWVAGSAHAIRAMPMRNRDCFVASLDFMRCLLSFACSGT
jgi:hypothetical protein